MPAGREAASAKVIRNFETEDRLVFGAIGADLDRSAMPNGNELRQPEPPAVPAGVAAKTIAKFGKRVGLPLPLNRAWDKTRNDDFDGCRIQARFGSDQNR